MGCSTRLFTVLWITGASMMLLTTAADALQQVSSGTGFIVNDEGYALTNAHVVTMEGQDGQKQVCNGFEARLGPWRGNATFVDADPVTDLALIRIDGLPGATASSGARTADSSGFAAAPETNVADLLADRTPSPISSDRQAAAAPAQGEVGSGKIAVARFAAAPPAVGQAVAAFGFPLGSALGSQLKVAAGNISSTAGIANDTSHLLHTAPIHGGNSGGPLIDSSGSVVGVNVGVLPANPDKKISQAINIAIRGDMAQRFLDNLSVAYGTTARGAEQSFEVLAVEAKAYTVQIFCLM